MSYTSNFLKALQEKGVGTKINAGGTTPPASLGNRSSGSDSSNYTSNFFSALEKQQSKSISEKAESRAQAMQKKLRGTSRQDTFDNAIRNAGGTTSGGYYSRQSLDTTGEKLHSNVTALEPVLTEKRTALDAAQSSLQQAETDLQTVQDHLNQAKAMYDADPTEANATSYNQIVGAYNLQYQAYSSAFETYSAAYNAYKPYEDEMVKALTAYQLHNNQQKAAFEDWRETIRDTQTIKADIDQLDGQIQELETEIGNLKILTWFRNDALGESMKQSLQEAQTKLETLRSSRDLLQEEYDWSEYYQYNDLLQSADFAEKSKYVTTANGLEPILNNLSGMYAETGFDDLTYDYINRNREARGKAMVNSIGDNTALLGLDKSYLEKMTDDEIAIFNYLYATQGADAAYQYTAYLTGDLTRRQRMEQDAKWAAWAEENPVRSSVFSVLMSPAKGISYLGQFADLTADGEINQNAAYNKFAHIPSAIRDEVAQQIEDSGKWGQVGSFAYQTGLSMADFLFATGISGGNSGLAMTIMGSGAAADTTLAARERGVDSGKAFALGTIAGLAEAITEKWSIEALLDPKLLKDGTLKYVLKNMLVEGGEEGTSDLINLFCDVLIAGGQSEWHQSIDAYVADGKTEREAFLLAFKDQALTVGLDMLGGALSGGVLSGSNATIQGYYNHRLAKQYDLKHVTENDAQEIIDSGLESDHNTESYQLAVKLQKKLEAGTIPTADELSRLLWATEQAIAQEEATEEPSDDTIIGDDQIGKVAGDVTDPGGLQLPSLENETQAPGFVTQNAQNGTQTQVNDTALPAGNPLSIADQLRQEQAQNGGTQYERTYERTAGPATAQPAGELYLPGGAGISDGSAERNAGAGTPEQTGVLAGGTEQRRSAWTDRSRATVARQNYARSLRLVKVSSLDLGLQNGTEARNIQVVPQENWDAEMSQLADRIYNETGKGVTFVMGRIQIRGSGGAVGYARGVITGDRIIVQADHLRIPMEQIADHEAYHAKVDFAAENRLDLNTEIKRHILDTFSAEQFQRVLDKYIVGLRGVIDVNETRNGAEFEAAVRQIEEEIFADAYAGINAFSAGADQFAGAVNEKMDQLYMGKIRNQDNGTEEPTGPPNNDRYSIETLPDGKKYVRADRQVIFGNDPDSWSEQVEDYINGRIRRGQDVTLIAEDGDALTITSTTAGKLADNHTSRGTTMSDEDFYLKTNAAVHIDELAEASRAVPGVTRQDVGGRHGEFASGGWTYRTAFFMDFDGKYYRLRISAAKNPDGTIVYNIGDVKERSFPTIDGSSAKGGALGGKTSFEKSVPQADQTVKQRFSYAGENANNADLDALARAKEMQAAGVADETIRQQTGWHTGMDGKWRWEIDDSGMEYSSRGDLGLRERRPEYARYRELLDKANRHALELSDEALTPEETAELQKLKNIWGGTFRKAGRITEDALPTELLSDYVKHDALFEAYPQLRKTRLRFADLPEGTRGQYDPEQDIITLSNKLRGKPQDTLVHEIQHVIQKAEGFAQGSSPEFWDGQQVAPPEYASEIQKAEDTVKKVEAEFHQEWPDDINLNLVKQYIELDNQLWGDGTDPIALQELADQMDQIEQLATESGWGDLFNDYYYAVGQLQMAKERAKLHRRTSIDLYRNTAGEIEARDAASRRQLTAEQRRNTTPARADDHTVFVEDIDGAAFAELDAQYGPQLQSAAEFDQDTISGNIRQVAQMEPVTSISGHEFAKGEVDLITQVETFFNQRGNRAYSPELGEVILDRKGVKSDIAHGIGRKKAAAFAAVPDVIEYGLVVDYQKDWKGRGYDTAVMAAPITIGDQTHAAAVILLRSDQTNRFYVHEVLAMENGALPFKTGTREGYPGGDAPSILSILDKIRSVKNETVTQERFSIDDASTQQSQDQKPAAPKKKIRPVAESRPLIAKKDLRSTVLNLFSIPNGQRAEVGAMIDSYADRLIKNGSLTEDDRKAFFDRMYDAGVMVMPADEYSAYARSHIEDGRIYVSDSVKADFGDDWADIRRRAFAAGVYLVNDRSASGIDQWNATLSAEDMLPGLFDSEETDERTILERILQVAEEGKDEHLSLAEYTRRLSQQEGISEDEFLDNMERQLDWALRTFAEKARLEVHLRDRTGRKIAQEREKGNQRMTRQQAKEAQRRADERQARKDSARRAKERRELRELQQRTLKQLQWLSRNRNRAPEELQATWDEILGDIDLYAISAADEMRWSDKHNATWKDLAQMYKDAMKNDPNFLPSKELERIVTRLDATKIADMDLGALQDLYKAAIGLRTEFYNRNNVINDEMQRLLAEVYTDAKREIENAPGENSAKKGKVSGLADKFLNLDQLTPMNVLQRMAGWDPDSAFYSMAKQLERGERDMRAYSVKAQKMLQDFLTEHEDWVKKADGQGKDAIWYEVEVPQLLELGMGDKPIFGPTVRVYMTPAQKVHMYLESKNLDNLRHMTGGRTFVNKDLYSQGKRQEALSQGRTIKLAPEIVRKLVSDLTPEEMELAQLLDRYYNTFATQEINKVSNILYGYDKAMGKNYAPIYTNRNYTKTEFGVFDTTAEGVGNLKGRQYAMNPSYNISAFDAFERHVDQTARFCGMAIPARNWTTLMNWREKNNSTGDVITHKWGEESKRYITDLITTLQAGDDAKCESVSTLASRLQSNYISAVFGANPSIVLKQLGSIPLAGAYLDARNMPTPAQISKIDRSLISKYTQELEWRTMGYATPETKQLKDNPNWTQTNKTFKFVFGGGAITAMDGWAASTLWPWAENKVRREHPELTVGNKAQIDAGESAFYKKVAEEFEIAVSRSQSVSDEIHQGTLRKSKNPITKAFTMFRSDSAQTYNALRQKIGEARYYMRTGAKEKVIQTAKKAAGTAFVAMLINAAWSEAVSFLMALWKNKGKYYRDDEDELTFQSIAGEMVSNMLGSYAGVVTGGEEVFELIGNIITGDKWYGIETPGMEQLNNIMDVIYESGSGMRDLVAGGWDILKNGGDLGDYFGKHSGQILGSIKDLAEAATMYLPGLPASNLEAYLIGALKWLSPELGAAYDDLFSNVGKGDLSKLKGDALVSRVGSIMEDRGMGDDEDIARIIAGLHEAGHKMAVPSDIPTSVSVDGENQKLSAYQQQVYGTVWKETVSTFLEDMVTSDRFMEADEESQAKMLDKLYDYAAVRAKTQLFEDYEVDDAVAKISTMKANGVAPSEYIVWNVTTSGLKTSEKMTILRDWDMSEEAKKAVVGSIIGTDLETEKGNPSQYAKFLSALEEGMTVDQYLSMRTDGVDVEDYLEATESGLDSDDALSLATAKSQLSPIDDEEYVSDLQRWRASVDFTDDVEDQLTALSMVMDDYELINVEIANDFGVAPDVYVRFYEIRSQYDADGSGSYKQVEIQTAIDAQFGHLSQQQKAALWQLMNGSTKSAKKNPYSKEIGKQVLDAKAAAKEAAAQKKSETPDDSADDDSFSQKLLNQLLGRG